MSDKNMPHTEKLARRILGLGWSRMVEPLPQIVAEALRLIEEDRADATATLRRELAEARAEVERLRCRVRDTEITLGKRHEERDQARAALSEARAALGGMRGERDAEREIAQGWERKAEDAEQALSEARKESARLREALEDAAKSLSWIAGRSRERDETHADAISEIRGYAHSRSEAARAAASPRETAPAAAPGLGFDDAVRIARGCHDYNGGHSGTDCETYHHGIQTVINALERAAKDGLKDLQLRVLHRIGAAPHNPQSEE